MSKENSHRHRHRHRHRPARRSPSLESACKTHVDLILACCLRMQVVGARTSGVHRLPRDLQVRESLVLALHLGVI